MKLKSAIGLAGFHQTGRRLPAVGAEIMISAAPASDSHLERIQDQFGRQAPKFAQSPELHGAKMLALLVDCARPRPNDETLDVACGPGTVVVAMARRVRRAAGLDATWPMLAQARRLADKEGVRNVAWYGGDAYALPFGEGLFDVVTCRFAFHHFEHPGAALREMMRVCKPGGVVLVCDMVASDDSSRAEALNTMERFRDPSTVEVRPLAALLGMFAGAGLPPPDRQFFQLPSERDEFVSRSFPVSGDRDGLRRMIDDLVADDTMGVGARLRAGTVVFAFPSVILSAVKPRAG